MDTLKAYEKLRVKFDDDTARVLVDSLGELVSPSLDSLVTKEDLGMAKAELHTEIQTVKAELHVEIQKVKTDIIRWFVGMTITQILALSGLILALFTIFK